MIKDLDPTMDEHMDRFFPVSIPPPEIFMTKKRGKDRQRQKAMQAVGGCCKEGEPG